MNHNSKTIDPWTPWYKDKSRDGSRPQNRLLYYKKILRDCYRRINYYKNLRTKEIQIKKNELSIDLNKLKISCQDKDYILNIYPFEWNPFNDYINHYDYQINSLFNYVKRLRELISEHTY